MSETNAGATPVAGDATSSQTPEATGTAAPSPTTGQAATDYPDGLGDAGKRAIDLMKAERDAAKRELTKAQGELKKHTDAQLTESEKLTKRLAELEAENASKSSQLQGMLLKSVVTAAAAKAGFWDPDVAVALIDPADVKYAEDGLPTNVDELLRAVARAKPRLVNGQGDAGLGPRGQAAGQAPDVNSMIRRSLGRG